MIEAERLGKSFKARQSKQLVKAIEEVTFSAADGQVTGLLGPNGAGKSTTLRILATLMKPDSGRALIDGFDALADPLSVRRNIGFMPHEAGIYPRLSARENIQYYASLCGVPKHTATVRIAELIDMLDMGNFIDRQATGFSQGQKTKVALARALVHQPQTLMLDEPTNGLDVIATRGLRDIIRKLAAEGHCVLFSSHIMQEVAALCDHIAIIAHGTIVMADTVDGIRLKTGQQDLEDAFVVATGGVV